jgi:hypothetical protein
MNVDIADAQVAELERARVEVRIQMRHHAHLRDGAGGIARILERNRVRSISPTGTNWLAPTSKRSTDGHLADTTPGVAKKRSKSGCGIGTIECRSRRAVPNGT